jgi:molybdate-binding protein
MEVKKLIKSIKNAFDITVEKDESKKNKLKKLIKELKLKKRELKEKMKHKKHKNKIEELQEDCDIITLQIKKSRRILKNIE